MAKYDIVYKCGHEDRVDITGSRAHREWELSQYQNSLCPDCLAGQREKHNEDCAAKNKDEGYPELVGSPKQIAWAESIRRDIFDDLNSEKFFERHERILECSFTYSEDPSKKQLYFEGLHIFENIIKNEDRSEWFIDHKGGDWIWRMKEFAIDYAIKKEEGEEIVIPKYKIVEPENVLHKGYVEIKLLETEDEDEYEEPQVTIKYSYSEELKKIVRMLGYRIDDNVYSRTVSPGAKSITNLLLFTANEILKGGFKVKLDEEFAELLESGEFQPINPREITISSTRLPYFKIKMEANKELFKIAESLPDSKGYFGYTLDVPRFYAAEVAEFAEIYNFSLSEGAKSLIDEIAGLEKAKIMPKEKKVDLVSAKEIFKKKDEVLDDLIDED